MPFSQPAHGFREAHIFNLTQEFENVTAGPAAKTVIPLPFFADVEGRRLF
jgi:hypothetical protein